MIQILPNNILLVVVLYNQQLWNCNTYKTLIKDNPKYLLFIYDNSPKAQHDQTEFDDNVKYTSDITNRGLSYAYNRAMEYAEKQGIQWLLLLDQDTIFPLEILTSYQNTLIKTESKYNIIVPNIKMLGGNYMSPVITYNHITKPSKIKALGELSLKKYSAINSGMMINVNAMREVGGYNEKVTIDFSDYQFLYRLSKKYNYLYVMDVECYQEFSNDVQTISQKLKRFSIFCSCLRECETDGFWDLISYYFIVLKRAISISIEAKNLKAFFIVHKNFIVKG